jgi:hypothetical protein
LIGVVDWAAAPGDGVEVTLCKARGGNFAVMPLLDGVATDGFDPSDLARWSPDMTDCARILSEGVVAVVAVVLDGLDAADVIAGDTLDGVAVSGCRLFSLVLVLLLTVVFLSL